jgi:hypothetical protein
MAAGHGTAALAPWPAESVLDTPQARLLRLPEEIALEMNMRLAELMKDAERDKRRDLILSGLACVAWATLGVLCVVWSAYTTNETYARLAFYGGVALGNGGVAFTLLAAYRRGEQRGDW